MRTLNCAHCANLFARPSNRGRIPSYCSANCRARASEVRAGTDGRLAEWRSRAQARKEPPPTGQWRSCVDCSAEFWHPRQRGHLPKFCSNKCKDRNQVKRWRADGRYDAYNAARRGPGSFCLDCATPLRTGAARCSVCSDKRPYIPEARRLAVYDRDGWECQLCGLPVVREARCPDPYSASLDHVVPFSMGGSDEEDNLQMAHFACNIRKSDRVGFTLMSSDDEIEFRALMGEYKVIGRDGEIKTSEEFAAALEELPPISEEWLSKLMTMPKYAGASSGQGMIRFLDLEE